MHLVKSILSQVPRCCGEITPYYSSQPYKARFKWKHTLSSKVSLSGEEGSFAFYEPEI